MKDMTTAATTMMSEEEKAEIEKQMNSPGTPAAEASASKQNLEQQAHEPSAATSVPSASASASGTANTDSETRPAAPEPQTSSSLVPHENGAESSSLNSPASPASPNSETHLSPKDAREKERLEMARKRKLQAEQREKLREQEKERRKAMDERVSVLTKKTIDRLRPFVEAKNPGDKDDPETQKFEAFIRREAEDLKLESFGIEVS